MLAITAAVHLYDTLPMPGYHMNLAMTSPSLCSLPFGVAGIALCRILRRIYSEAVLSICSVEDNAVVSVLLNVALVNHLVHELCRGPALICLMLEQIHLLPELDELLRDINCLLFLSDLLLLILLNLELGVPSLSA